MKISTDSIEIACEGFCDIHDITDEVEAMVRSSGVNDGQVTVFVPGSTAGITTIEFESGAVQDLRRAIEQSAPEGEEYAHNARWDDGNGFSHVRASLMGPSMTVPISGGRLQMGTWQQIILCDFDNRSRVRQVVVQSLGE